MTYSGLRSIRSRPARGPHALFIVLLLVAFAPGCRCSKEAQDRNAAAPDAASAPPPLVETPSATPQARQREGKLPFWKIGSSNATLYVLGSIPVSSGEFYPLPDR